MSNDHVAATRVISVVARPSETDPEIWETKVDYDDWISPYEAWALLKIGVDRLEARLFERQDEER